MTLVGLKRNRRWPAPYQAPAGAEASTPLPAKLSPHLPHVVLCGYFQRLLGPDIRHAPAVLWWEDTMGNIRASSSQSAYFPSPFLLQAHIAAFSSVSSHGFPFLLFIVPFHRTSLIEVLPFFIPLAGSLKHYITHLSTFGSFSRQLPDQSFRAVHFLSRTLQNKSIQDAFYRPYRRLRPCWRCACFCPRLRQQRCHQRCLLWRLRGQLFPLHG